MMTYDLEITPWLPNSGHLESTTFDFLVHQKLPKEEKIGVLEPIEH